MFDKLLWFVVGVTSQQKAAVFDLSVSPKPEMRPFPSLKHLHIELGDCQIKKEKAMRFTRSIPFAVCVAIATSHAVAETCPEIAQLRDQACVATTEGYFYSSNKADAEKMAEDAAIAATKFSRYFSASAPKAAVVSIGANNLLNADVTNALKASGAKFVLPWLNAAEKQALKLRSIRQAIAKQLQAKEDDPRVEAALKVATMQLDQTSSARQATGKTSDTTDRSALRHEIGHMLLIAQFWSKDQKATKASAHYGGPAPDWLDESAAVLMEDEAMTLVRRTHLLALRDQKDAAGIQPLAKFFSGDHPLKSIAETTSRPTGGASVRIISGERAKALGDQASWFYSQTRGVADFLIAQSGDERIFSHIAQAASQGQTFAQWLQSDGKNHNFPNNLAALEQQWLAWLRDQRV
jgi:hypothetical protein